MGHYFVYTHDEYIKMIYEKYGDEYTIIGKYTGCCNEDRITVRHNCELCNNNIWDPLARDFLHGKSSCPICANKHRNDNKRFKISDVQKRLDSLYGVNTYTVTGYIPGKKIFADCNICGKNFDIHPNNAYNKNNKVICKSCKKEISKSAAANYIEDYLNKNNIIYLDEEGYPDCKYKAELKFDFIINNIHLEYDGELHWTGRSHKKASKILNQTRDSIKNDYCLNNNLFLIRIPYVEESNLEIILDAIMNYNEELLKKHNCLIIKNGEIINKPDIYSWYNENSIILNESEE